MKFRQYFLDRKLFFNFRFSLKKWVGIKYKTSLAGDIAADIKRKMESNEFQTRSFSEMHGDYVYFIDYMNFSEGGVCLKRSVSQNGLPVTKAVTVLDFKFLANLLMTSISFIKLRATLDNRYLAFTLESKDQNMETLFIKDCSSNIYCRLMLEDQMVGSIIDFEWSSCNEENFSLFISLCSYGDLRASKIYRLRLNPEKCFGRARVWKGASARYARTNEAFRCELVWDETNPAHFLTLTKSKDAQYVLMHSHSKLSTEVRAVDAYDHRATWFVAHNRRRAERCFVDHALGGFLKVRSLLNDEPLRDGELELLFRARGPEESYRWRRLWPRGNGDEGTATARLGEAGVVMTDYDVFAHALVIYGRDKRGLPAVLLYRLLHTNTREGTGTEFQLDLWRHTVADDVAKALGDYQGLNEEFWAFEILPEKSGSPLQSFVWFSAASLLQLSTYRGHRSVR